ncbi:MAG: 4Fe-4S dicluster domain-containing protein [Candidatus Latescibacterota bacterium]|nr:4Fe-4S dicluster domain-containing protein [Candidatus Latescibacterota bacterium]
MPFLQPNLNACRWCPSMDCVRACPTPALQVGESGRISPMAVAALQESSCLNRQGVLCDSCATVCPSPLRAITVSVGREPEIDVQTCVGCGLCVVHCEAATVPLRVMPLHR